MFIPVYAELNYGIGKSKRKSCKISSISADVIVVVEFRKMLQFVPLLTRVEK